MSRSSSKEIAEQEIKEFFKGRAASFRLFRIIRKMVEAIGSPGIVVTKSQVSFGEDHKYLWVWLPQMWIKKRPEEGIAITIVTGTKIRSPRIEESVQPKKGYWTHHILINSKEEIDSEIEELLRKSYAFYLERVRQKQKKTGVMDKSIFTDKKQEPQEGDLEKALGDTFALWQHIAAYVHERYPAARDEWKYGGEKFGWSFRINDKKRVIIYLLPRDGFFKVAMVFGNKAVEAVMTGRISKAVKDELQQAKPYAEGRGIRIDVSNKKALKDIEQLVDIKLEN